MTSQTNYTDKDKYLRLEPKGGAALRRGSAVPLDFISENKSDLVEDGLSGIDGNFLEKLQSILTEVKAFEKYFASEMKRIRTQHYEHY